MKIDKGYAIISRNKLEYPFKRMDVSDSFLVPQGVTRNRVKSAASYWARKLGYRFSIRVTQDGIRVWRVE